MRRRKSKTILLTRSLENNFDLKNKLLLKNYQVLEEPLIDFLVKEEQLQNLKEIIANHILIITSKFAAMYIAKAYKNQNIECYVVGEDTANLLSKNGFKIKRSFQNIRELENEVTPSNNLLYIRGEIITQQLNLKQRESIIYSTIYKNRLAQNVIDLINKDELDIVSIYSLKTAEAFVNSVINSSIAQDKIKNLSFYCLSKKIAKYLTKRGCIKVKFPDKSNQSQFEALF